MITIKVPATTANIGPGFDSQGMAIALYNEFTFTLREGLAAQTTLIHQAFDYFYRRNGLQTPLVNIEVKANIPQARGLGSSATCVVAGLMAANSLSGLLLSKETLLYYGTQLEGHPDNVAPALYGGHITSVIEGERVVFSKKIVSNHLAFMVLIPDFELKTALARAAIQQDVPLVHAVSNIARATLVSDALHSGDFALLQASAKDFLHEPFRRPFIADYPIFAKLCQEHQGALFISGAGPSLLVVSQKGNSALHTALNNPLHLKATWQVLPVQIANEGSIIL